MGNAWDMDLLIFNRSAIVLLELENLCNQFTQFNYRFAKKRENTVAKLDDYTKMIVYK